MKTLRSRTRGVLFYLAGWSPLAVLFTIVMRYMDVGGWLIAAGYALTYLVPAIALGAFFWVKVEEKIHWERQTWFQLFCRELANALAYTVGMHALFALVCGRRGGAQPSMRHRRASGLGALVRRAALPGAGGRVPFDPHLRRAASKEIAAAEAESLRVRAEMEALRGQLNPHFLFNSLHSITALVRSDPPRAEEALLQFAGLLRRVLALKRETADEVSLTEEMAFVDDYLAIERFAAGERLRVTRAISTEAQQCRLPAFSVQPLVENAIRYAVAPRRDGGTVTLDGAVRDGRLVFTVADDGPGADPATIAAAPGVGLSVIRRQLQLRYGERAAFRVDTAPGNGFRVTLALPAVKENTA